MDKNYNEPEEPTVYRDLETGEEYIINPTGSRIYLPVDNY